MRFAWPPWRRSPSRWVGLTTEAEEITLALVGGGHSSGTELLAADAQYGAFTGENLGELVERNNAAGAACVLTLEPGAYSLFQVERPAVGADEIHAAVRWKIKDLVEFPLDEAVLDVFDVPPRSQGQGSGSVYVAVAHAPYLKPRIDAIHEAELKLERIDIAELSLRNIAAHITDADEAIALIHLGRYRGMVSIARGSTLYLARPLGYGFDTLGSGAPSEEDEIGFADADPGFEAIALELQRTADYFDSYFGQAPVRRIRVVPGLPSLEGLVSHLGANLDLDAQLVPFEQLGMPSPDVDAAALAPGVLALGGVLTPAGDA